MSPPSIARIGIVTASDRASQGVYEDLSGKAIEQVLTEYLASQWGSLFFFLAAALLLAWRPQGLLRR